MMTPFGCSGASHTVRTDVALIGLRRGGETPLGAPSNVVAWTELLSAVPTPFDKIT